MSITKKIIIAVVILVVGVLALKGLSKESPQPVVETQPTTEKDLGRETHSSVDHFVEGAQLGDEIVVWESRSIGARDNNDGWENKTGRTVYVDLVTVNTTGTASTTMTIDIATSTSANLSDYSDTHFSEFIDSYELATSTPAITINSMENQGTNGTQVVAVGAGEFISFLLQAGETEQAGEPSCDGSLCETATSTNRGFNLTWKFRYFYQQ